MSLSKNQPCDSLDRRVVAIKQQLKHNLPYFVALGDSDRQQILFQLAVDTPISVTELATKLGLSRPSVSYHIRILKQAGLLDEQKHGVKTYYRPTYRKGIEDFHALTQTLTDIEEELL